MVVQSIMSDCQIIVQFQNGAVGMVNCGRMPYDACNAIILLFDLFPKSHPKSGHGRNCYWTDKICYYQNRTFVGGEWDEQAKGFTAEWRPLYMHE